MQVGLSYGADSKSESSVTSPPDGNDNAVVAAGIDLNRTIADASVNISLGHRAASQDGMDDDTFTNAGLALGMGAFGFNVAYAERDKGTGMSADEWTVVGASVKYTDGPMAVSLDYMVHETEARTARRVARRVSPLAG